MNCASTDGAVTYDSILDGHLKLAQPARGHRAGTDAILLAAAIPADASGLAIDIGAGVGTIGLILALRSPALSVVLVERDPLLAKLARDNIDANDLSSRVTAIEGNLFDAELLRDTGGADFVLTNPPFLNQTRDRASRDRLKRVAHVEDRPLGEWVRASLALLRSGGVFAAIHRADAMADLLAACGAQLGALSLTPIHPRTDENATRVIVTGRKGSRAPLTIQPGFVLHGANGQFTEAAERLHRNL